MKIPSSTKRKSKRPAASSSPSFGANREYKDSVFALALIEAAAEGALVPLSNALLGTNYGPDTKVDVSTIKKVLANCRMNDLSYIIDNRLIVLIEHQSTINENMPYRMLTFYAESMRRLHSEKDEYRRQMFKIQRPKFIVLYNGAEEMEDDVMTLRLSDMFEKLKPEEKPDGEELIDLELVVTVYNINNGRNADIVNSCAALRDYCIFINMIREYKAVMSLEAAIQKAVEDCIDKDVMKAFLLKYKGDVINMLTKGFNLDLAVEVAKEEGMARGMARGMTIGESRRAIEIAKRMIADNRDVVEIARYTGLDQDDVLRLMGAM